MMLLILFVFLLIVVTSADSLKASNKAFNPAEWTRGAPPFRNLNSSKHIYQERIIDGIKADFGTFSFMVSIWYKDQQHYCGGTILNDLTILTAAHCVVGPKSKGFAPTDMVARVGSANNQEGYQAYPVSDWTAEPDFDLDKLGSGRDVGVLTLQNPIDLSLQTAQKVCFPENANDPPKVEECIVMGWGYTKPGTDPSPVLMQVEAPILPSETCNAYIGDVDMDQLYCAGFVDGGKDACQGDSGGPLMCRAALDDAWLQYGIVSWGRGCGKTFGFYTRIIPNFEFIVKASGANE